MSGASIGTGIEGHIGFAGTAFTVAWNIVRWALTVILVTLLFSVCCFFGPNRDARWQWVSPGGIAGTVIFLAAAHKSELFVLRCNLLTNQRFSLHTGTSRKARSLRFEYPEVPQPSLSGCPARASYDSVDSQAVPTDRRLRDD